MIRISLPLTSLIYHPRVIGPPADGLLAVISLCVLIYDCTAELSGQRATQSSLQPLIMCAAQQHSSTRDNTH